MTEGFKYGFEIVLGGAAGLAVLVVTTFIIEFLRQFIMRYRQGSNPGLAGYTTGIKKWVLFALTYALNPRWWI